MKPDICQLFSLANSMDPDHLASLVNSVDQDQLASEVAVILFGILGSYL